MNQINYQNNIDFKIDNNKIATLSPKDSVFNIVGEACLNMQNNTIPASFNLSRYLDDGSLTKLDWKNTAFVSGLLRGGSSELLKNHI